MTSSLNALREPRGRPAGLPETPGCQRGEGMMLLFALLLLRQLYGAVEDSAS